jgi:hypothetical protein
VFETLNYIEAALWGVIGVVLFAFAAGRAGARRRRAAVAAGTFVLFGVSDVIEVRTGAWWRPWWLLAWKAACVFSLVVLLVGHYRTKGARPESRSDSGESEPSSD